MKKTDDRHGYRTCDKQHSYVQPSFENILLNFRLHAVFFLLKRSECASSVDEMICSRFLPIENRMREEDDDENIVLCSVFVTFMVIIMHK